MRVGCWDGKSYNYLKPEERATVMLMMRDGAMVRSIARTLSRAPSTISRELKKNCPDGQKYEAAAAGERARERRYQRRRWPKLGPHSVLFGVVEYFLRDRWSPPSISSEGHGSVRPHTRPIESDCLAAELSTSKNSWVLNPASGLQ